MNKIQAAASIASRSISTSVRSRGPVSMKEPYNVRKTHEAGDGSAGGIIPASPGYQRIVKQQQAWSVEDGTMVWQKTSTDGAMYNVTLAACAAGALYGFYLIGTMSFPKKPE